MHIQYFHIDVFGSRLLPGWPQITATPSRHLVLLVPLSLLSRSSFNHTTALLTVIY